MVFKNLLALIWLYTFSAFSIADPGKSLINGQLMTCPSTPNCVSTEQGDLEPISIVGYAPEQAWLLLQASIVEQEGMIEKISPSYLWASFQTPLFKFTDDVEARLDLEHQVIHLRSASQEGYYDFNTNNNRLKRLIDIFSNKLNPERLKNIHQ